MDLIEPWLNISPDGENGASELRIVILIIISVVVAALRRNFPKNFIELLEQLGKRESSDRFDNLISAIHQ